MLGSKDPSGAALDRVGCQPRWFGGEVGLLERPRLGTDPNATRRPCDQPQFHNIRACQKRSTRTPLTESSQLRAGGPMALR